MTDEKHNPFDDLAEHLNFCVSIAPNKVVEVVAKTLEENGIRVVLVAVSDDWQHPQVELTARIEDVTSKVTTQVVEKILRKAAPKVGLPENMINMLSVAAGEAAVRALHKYTNPDQGRTDGFTPRNPAWDPRRRRGGGR